MSRFILLALLALGLLSSCGKNRNIHIVAKNAATGEGYAGLEYVVLSSRTTADGEKFKTEASGTLNANGEAVVEVKVKSSRTYKVRVSEPANNCYTNQVEQYFESQYDQNGTFTFEFAPCGFLTLSVNNTNCIDVNDKILFDLQPQYLPDYDNIIPTEKMGCYTNTFAASTVPVGNWIATWQVTKNNVTSNYDSVFTVVENQATNFTINY